MRRALAVGATLVVVSSGCGKGLGPSAPDAAAPRVLVVMSGETGQPVAGGRVVLETGSLQTNERGEVVIPGGANGDIEVHAEGFLSRGTRLPRKGRLTLWPTRPSYPQQYVRDLLYKPSRATAAFMASVPDEPLHRVVTTRVSVVPSSELRADARALQAHRSAVAEINEATELRVVFTVDAEPVAGAVVFRTYLDRNLDVAGRAYRELRGDVIVGGRVAFQSRPIARDSRYVAHELGHVLGLQHSTVTTDMMYYQCGDACPRSFTDNERLTIRLLLQRPPGNRFPDDDRVVLGGAPTIAAGGE
jgi:predicted Zn-dependent protease